jgi:hypothetical protein
MKKEVETEKDIRIVILQRGWVYVGEYYEDGMDCRLEKAKNIRHWGTTKGLGELASNGPLKNTVLDESGIVRFHKMTTIATLDCEKNQWKL